MALVQMNFESQYLGVNHEISIILPDKPRDKTPAQFYGSGAKYKVLWLLHGTFGDHSDWVRKSMIELYACERDLIVVMPSGLNAEYANWPRFSIGYNFFDYFTEELMPMIYNWYPASSKREDNFIAGLSMGGSGCIKFAANHPDKFAGAAILSSAPANLKKYDPSGGQEVPQRTANAIANAGGYDKYAAGPDNTWEILKKLAPSGKLPKLYFTVGKDDFLYSRYMEFKEYAKEIKLDAKFEEIAGYKHEWRFWDLTIQKALAFFGITDSAAGNPF